MKNKKSIDQQSPRPMSLVKFTLPMFPKIKGGWAKKYPFKENESYIFLGEIPNMRGHCVIAEKKDGRIFAGYDTDLFDELSGDEV